MTTTLPTSPDAPAASVTDVELADGVAPLCAAAGAQAWLVVRLFTEPLGIVVIDVPPAGLTPAVVLDRIVDELRPAIAPRLVQAGLRLTDLGPHGAQPVVTPAILARRAAVLQDFPRCTVVICTRDRPDGLRRTLTSLVAQDHADFEVVVVDSASSDDRTRTVAAEFADTLDIRYLRSQLPGLSRARNLGLAAVATHVVAWLDDDATADLHWIGELARGFAAAPGTVAVSGMVVPRTLHRREQIWFEQFGGHSKGRGFTSETFSPATHVRQSPLYPLPAFGVGTNMAFSTRMLRAIGGFDEALGAGTRTCAGEDTKAFTQVMLAGGTMVYQPAALVRHVHRPTLESLRAQLDGYGTGLTAFYTALIMDRPSLLISLLRLLPAALRDLRGSGRSTRTSTIEQDFPQMLLASNLRAMLRGPAAYVRQRVGNRSEGRRATR